MYKSQENDVWISYVGKNVYIGYVSLAKSFQVPSSFDAQISLD